MTLSRFQEMLLKLRPIVFEQFVADTIAATSRFREIRHDVLIAGSQVDIEAIEADSISVTPQRWLFEVKSHPRLTVNEVLSVVARDSGMSVSQANYKFVLVAAGQLTGQARETAKTYNMEIWDAPVLFRMLTEEVAKRYFGEFPEHSENKTSSEAKAEALRDSLLATPKGKSHAIQYQQVCAQVLEYLFCPPLQAPHCEIEDTEARNRRDMIFENTASDGWWAHIRNIYAAHYIVADAKNYSSPLEKRPVLDIAHYLKPYGCGLFGLLVSREGAGEAASHAIREHWIGAKKLIVVLSDSDIFEMLNMRKSGGRPEEVIRQKIGEFRMKL